VAGGCDAAATTLPAISALFMLTTLERQQVAA
jgi:hypothetical protein